MNAIKKMRTQNDLSQSALAELLGVSQQAVAQWEIGKAIPRSETLMKLTDLFDCTIDEIYGRDPSGRDQSGRDSA